MNDQDWDSGLSSVAVLLNGDAMTETDQRGEPVTDASFLMVFNGHHQTVNWTLPKWPGERWTVLIDTSGGDRDGKQFDSGQSLLAAARSVVLLCRDETA